MHIDQKEARVCYAEILIVEPLRNDLSPKRKSSRKGCSSQEIRLMSVEPTVALVDLNPQAIEDRLEAREKLRRVSLLDEERSIAVGTAMAAAEA